MSDSDSYQLYCDGACRGNPGPAAIGGVILENGSTIEEISEHIGTATNNEAEYRSLVRGLEVLRDLLKKNDHESSTTKASDAERKATSLEIFMDSELVVRQVEGRYKVKNERLRPLYEQVRALLDEWPTWKIRHVPRAQNAEADRLANAAYT